MHGVDDGPQCSLISYIVPPGLSRVPTVGPSDAVQGTVTPLETISAKTSCVTEGIVRSESLRPKEIAVHPSSSRPSEVIVGAGGVRKALSTSAPLAEPSGQSAPRSEKKSDHSSQPELQSQQPRKSCLAKSAPAVIPARLNLKRKTVAFGKTVNVSQTIEGTSRLSRLRNMMNKSDPSQGEPKCNSENKENEPQNSGKECEEPTTVMDLLKDVKSSLDALKIRDEERAEELRSIRQMVIERGKEVDLLRGMFADYIGKDCPRSSDSKGSMSPKRATHGEVHPCEKMEKKQLIRSPQHSNQRCYRSAIREVDNKMSHFDSDPDDDGEITFEEFRRLLTSNPTLRQFVADIRAEEKDQRIGDADRRTKVGRGVFSRWRSSPRPIQRCNETKIERGRRGEDVEQPGPRGAKYTEKVTVERSVRCSPPELAQYSVDTRRYLEDQILDDNEETVESMYRPGESVSYYPERFHRHEYNGGSPDSNEDIRGGRRYHDCLTIEERRNQRRSRRTDRYQEY